MTFTGSVRTAGLSLLLLLLFPGCEKGEQAEKQVSDYFLTSAGGVHEDPLDDFRVLIPAGALAEDQYLVVKEQSGYEQVISGTDQKLIVTTPLSMVAYNGGQLLLPGTIEFKYLKPHLGYPVDNWEFTDTDIKAFYTDNKNDFGDYSKWIEVPVQVRNDSMITIQFTDLTKTYFLGWSD